MSILAGDFEPSLRLFRRGDRISNRSEIMPYRPGSQPNPSLRNIGTCFARSRFTSFCFRLGVILILVLVNSLPSAMARKQGQSPVTTIEGTIHDTAGKAVPDATVLLKEKGNASIAAVKTNADGAFLLSVDHAGTYTVLAKKPGWLDCVVDALVLSRGDKKHIDLVLAATGSVKFESAASHPSKTSPDAMEFNDEPSFTVAGVTDWSNLGLHGSAAASKTSESLARETLALKSAKPETSPLLSPSPRYEAALREYANGNYAAARAQIQKLLAKVDDAEGHRLVAELDERLNDPLEAVREYERAARMDPSEQNYFAWGSELLLHKAAEPAIEVFTRGAMAHPKSARMLTGLGAAFYTTGTYDEAARRLCEAADLAPADPSPYLFLGEIEKTTPATLACSEAKLAHFANEQPGNALANYYYAMSLSKRAKSSGDSETLKQVQTLLERAVAINSQFDEAYLQLGMLQSSRSNVDQALRDYRIAIDINPRLAEAHRQLGLLYQRTNQSAKAQQEFSEYERIEKADAAETERQRRELRQFLIILKDQPAGATPR